MREIHGPDQVLVVVARIQQDVFASPRRHLDHTVESPNNDVVAIREHKNQLNGQDWNDKQHGDQPRIILWEEIRQPRVLM